MGRHGTLCVGVRLFCVGPGRSLNFCVGPSWLLCRVPSLYVSGPGALCVGARRSLCRGPARSVSGPGALCVGAALFVSGPGALCLGARRPALSVSGPGAFSLSVTGPGAFCRGRCSLCWWSRRSSCVEPRRSLCRYPAPHYAQVTSVYSIQICFSVAKLSGLCRAPALSVSGPGALSLSVSCPCCFRVQSSRSLSRVPALSVSGPGALCLRARRSLCQGPALFVSGPGALCVGPRCRGLALSASRPGALSLCRRSLCRAPALSVSGPDALRVRPRRSLAFCVVPPRFLCPVGARGPALPRRSLSRAPTVFASHQKCGRNYMAIEYFRIKTLDISIEEGFCCKASRSVLGPGGFGVGSRRSLCRAPALSVSGPGALCVGPGAVSLSVSCPAISVSSPVALCVRARRSLCRGPALSVWGPGVGAWRSLRRAPALFLSVGALCVGPRRFLCRDPTLSVSGPGALSLSVSCPRDFCVQSGRGARRSPGALSLGPQRSLRLIRSVAGITWRLNIFGLKR